MQFKYSFVVSKRYSWHESARLTISAYANQRKVNTIPTLPVRIKSQDQPQTKWEFNFFYHTIPYIIQHFFLTVESFCWQSRILFLTVEIFFWQSRILFLTVEIFFWQSRIFCDSRDYFLTVENFFWPSRFFLGSREFFLAVENYFFDIREYLTVENIF